MDFTRYNKFISVAVGNAVGFTLVWLATKTPMATCTDTTCTLLGIPQDQITAAVMALITSIAVVASPKNSSTNEELVKEVSAAVNATTGGRLVRNLELEDSIEGRALNATTASNVTVARSAPIKP